MKKILPTIKSLGLGIVIALVASYASANTWSNPPGSPPSANTDTPITVSILDQVKGSPQSTSALVVDTFQSAQNAQFESDAYIYGVLRADSPTNLSAQSTLKFGGTDPLGVNRIVDLLIKGKITSSKSIKLDSLANNTMREVCADTAGKLVLCTSSTTTPTYVCSNLSGGPYTSVPSGYILQSNGDCVATTPPPQSNCPAGKVEVIPGYCEVPGATVGLNKTALGTYLNDSYRSSINIITSTKMTSATSFTMKWKWRLADGSTVDRSMLVTIEADSLWGIGMDAIGSEPVYLSNNPLRPVGIVNNDGTVVGFPASSQIETKNAACIDTPPPSINLIASNLIQC